MQKYNDLELSILSCLLMKPSLMEQVILEDKHFIKQQKIWQFMKAFYKKFGNFDLNLMMSVSKNKYRMIEYIMWILDKEPTTAHFNEYQKHLIELYNEGKKEKWIIDKIFELSNDLLVRNIDVQNYKLRIEEIYKNADEIFK